ncbi:MAG: flagellar export protein FliJ [Armatimonadetes bacterium]|nr:flagellar export protein FliJ [Armatimonadota bacterium]
MAQFRFRFEKLLEYRTLQEKWAQDAHVEAMARQRECEQEIEALVRRRQEAMTAGTCGLEGRLALDGYLNRLSDEADEFRAVLGVLESDVEKARNEWLKARQDKQAMEKLRESDLAEWQLEENRREQAELDEWAVMRRAS